MEVHHQSQNSSHLNGMTEGEAPKHMAKTYDKRGPNGHHISSQLIVNNEILNKEIQTQQQTVQRKIVTTSFQQVNSNQ